MTSALCGFLYPHGFLTLRMPGDSAITLLQSLLGDQTAFSVFCVWHFFTTTPDISTLVSSLHSTIAGFMITNKNTFSKNLEENALYHLIVTPACKPVFHIIVFAFCSLRVNWSTGGSISRKNPHHSGDVVPFPGSEDPRENDCSVFLLRKFHGRTNLERLEKNGGVVKKSRNDLVFLENNNRLFTYNTFFSMITIVLKLYYCTITTDGTTCLDK